MALKVKGKEYQRRRHQVQTDDEKSQMSTGFKDIDHGPFGGMLVE